MKRVRRKGRPEPFYRARRPNFMKPVSMLLVTIVACGQAAEVTGMSTTTTGQTTTTTEVSSTRSIPPSLPGTLAQDIVADAADRTGVPIEQIEVVSIEERTFNDSSLGCPEPGMFYTQVLTPGLIVLVDASGEELDYRVASGSESFNFCATN